MEGDAPVVDLLCIAASRRRLASQQIRNDEHETKERGQAEHDARIKPRADRHQRARLEVERQREKKKARRSDGEPGPTVLRELQRFCSSAGFNASKGRGLWQ